MREITIKTYSFKELGKEARKNVLTRLYDINVDDNDWGDNTVEHYAEKLKKLGYEDIKIYYSGFASQGDGACFIARVNVEKWLKAHKLYKKYVKLIDFLSINIIHNSRYYYAKSTTVDYDLAGQQDWTRAGEIVKLIEEERERYGNDLYRALEKEYYYQTDEAQVIKTIELNDYRFLKNGEFAPR